MDQAAVIVRFFNEVHRVADPVALHEVVSSMVEHVEDFSVKQLRQLVAQARAALRPPKDVEDEAARMRAGRSFTKVGQCAGMTEYRLRLDPEGAAIVDAAIDPLARPRPDLDWDAYRQPADRSRACPHLAARDCVGPCTCEPGCECLSDCATPEAKRDPRHAPTRRADALLELIGRAVAAPEGVTRTPRTQLVVTMTLEALLAAIRDAGVGGVDVERRADGTATGVADNGQVLSAGTIRRLACEATIIPAVLGAGSAVLDLGFVERYFTPAQRRALIIRDKGCTYPGCTIPAQWCEAHHVTHWCHGGPTDVSNGALLCGRHHTIVHQLELTATVTSFGVTWHLPAHHQ